MRVLSLFSAEPNRARMEFVFNRFGCDSISYWGNTTQIKNKISEVQPHLIFCQMYWDDIETHIKVKAWDVLRYTRDLDFIFRPYIVVVEFWKDKKYRCLAEEFGSDEIVHIPVGKQTIKRVVKEQREKLGWIGDMEPA